MNRVDGPRVAPPGPSFGAVDGASRAFHMPGYLQNTALRRLPAQASRIVGLYQMLLRRGVEHFFPEAVLEPAGDRSLIGIAAAAQESTYRIGVEPQGVGVELEWFGARHVLLPGGPNPFLPSERDLLEALLRVLDHRFRSLFDPEVAHREDALQYAVEDQAIGEYLRTPEAERIPAALEALRVAALSTYENRRVSSGVVLLGTRCDPAEPGRVNPPGAPRYSVRLSALKSIHRICDGLRTAYLVDRRGDLAWPVDLARWAAAVHGPGATLPAPCPRPYVAHARATLADGHVVLILTPAQEIKVFTGGTMAFAFSDARWRLLDIPAKFAAWVEAVGPSRPRDLAERVFQAALNLSEDRRGGLFVVLRDPDASLTTLVAPEDRICHEIPRDDPDDPENLSPRLAKRALHHLIHGQDLASLDATVLESLAGIDGAVVTDAEGRLISFGAILRLAADSIELPRAAQGARTTAALAASFHGPVLKVSEDGFLSMFLGGRRIWEI